ncbi:hypothetical protein BDD12DRAFT_481018 [Trichophaea hybrida]|nr:hypothetical protein BDD12DRAFT_481018 [Trichophaea hybrida]
MDLIGKLDNYKNILALFPSQSMLTSTFSAALKAALDYSKTVEGLIPALVEITTAAGSVGDQHALFRTAEMRRYVVVFYSRILQFCSKAIQWYQSKKRKFFGTIKDNPYQDFKDMIDSIKEQAGLIRDVAIKGQQAEGRVIHEKLDLYGKALIREIEALKMQNWNYHLHLHQHYNIIVNVMPATGNKEIGRRRAIKPSLGEFH